MKIFKVESIREKDDSKFHRNEFIEAENAKEALKKHPYKDYIVKFVQDHEPNYAVGVLNDCDSFGNEGYLSAIEIDKNSIEDDEDYDDENEYGEEVDCCAMVTIEKSKKRARLIFLIIFDFILKSLVQTFKQKI